MKLFAIVLGGALLASLPAAADGDVDFASIKCKDFLATDSSKISLILFWLEGYFTKEDDPPILHQDKMVEDAKKLGAYCAAHGEDGLITAAEAVMPAK